MSKVMNENLKKKIIESFNDEVALKTSFKPLKKGGTNITSHELLKVSPRRLEFRFTTQGLLFSIFFIGFGLVAALGGLGYLFITKEIIAIVIALMGIVFTVGGVKMYIDASKPKNFDLDYGYYWEGKKEPQDSDDACLLNGVYAIQLIAEYIVTDHTRSGANSSFYSYELNLVLKDGERLNVIDHGNLSRIIEDAKQLADFLDIPLWNLILDDEKK